MSVQNVRDAIERFLSTTTPQVLCIRGHWGTGKTYTWNDILVRQAKAKHIALQKYAHASLFGLNTLAELKQGIFQSTKAVDRIGKPFDVDDIKSVWDSGLSWGKWAADKLKYLHKDGFSAAMEFASLFARDQIIFIDDLERKGDGLRIVDVLGYIAQLRDERNCKIVLVLNDEQLKDKPEFEAYLEKVVDVYLRFAPTGQDIAYIAIPEDDQDNIGDMVRANAIMLGINNVRVIRKILALVRQVVPLLEGYSFQVTINAVNTITLLGWSYFQPEIAPPLNFLKNFHAFSSSTDEETSPLLKWRDLLIEYHYSSTGDFDLVLLNGIENGYFEKAEIDKHAIELNRAEIQDKVEREYGECWDELFYSFTRPQGSILDKFFEVYKSHPEQMYLRNAIALEKLFRESEDPRSDEIVDIYIETKKTVPGAFQINELQFAGEELPDALRQKLEAAGKSQQPVLTPDEIILALADRGFEAEILQLAAALPVTEYHRILISHEGAELANILKGLRQYLNVLEGSKEMQTIMENGAQALRAIETNTPSNRIRARRPGLIQWLEAREAAAEPAAPAI